MQSLLLWIACSFFLASLEGVVWRHDVPEKHYLSFGNQDHFLPVGRVSCRGMSSTGTLIAPNLVLVSAHGIAQDAIVYFDIYNPIKQHFENVRGRAERHPEYFQSKGDHQQIIAVFHDIGIVTLDDDILGVPLAKMWFGNIDAKMPCTCCGFGKTGTGLSGPQKSDLKKRGFTNTLTDNITDAAANKFYTICFNSPEETQKITSLEGIGSSGDSGAPVFVLIDGEHVMIGILNLLIKRGFYRSINTILPLIDYEEWFENIPSVW